MSSLELEIVSLKKVLQKEFDNEAKVLDALDILKDVSITVEMLKSTRIGKTMARVVRDGSDTVKAKAKPILEKWKAVAKVDASASDKPSAKKKVAEASKTPSSEAKAKGRTTVAFPSDSTRNKLCMLLEELFAKDEGTRDSKRQLVKGIEECIYDLGKGNPRSKEYKDKFRTLHFNLPKNNELRADLLAGYLEPKELVKMAPTDLANAKIQQERTKAKQAMFDAARGDWLDANRDNINKQAGVTGDNGMFECGRCKSTKTTHYQKQTRSADEPMTVFVQCTECGNRWKC